MSAQAFFFRSSAWKREFGSRSVWRRRARALRRAPAQGQLCERANRSRALGQPQSRARASARRHASKPRAQPSPPHDDAPSPPHMMKKRTWPRATTLREFERSRYLSLSLERVLFQQRAVAQPRDSWNRCATHSTTPRAKPHRRDTLSSIHAAPVQRRTSVKIKINVSLCKLPVRLEAWAGIPLLYFKIVSSAE